ncbi:MAG: sulfatase-like hydrolase/transferase [Myxococcales bacterium]|nr:sulfatase-like hydrolase/transferase [Myxococcales bacterium]
MGTWLPWAAVAAAVVGLSDASWAMWHTPVALEARARLDLLVAGAAVLVVPAVILAALGVVATMALDRSPAGPRLGQMVRSQPLRRGMLATGGLGLVALLWIADERDLDWATVDPRPLAFGLVALVVWRLGVRRFCFAPRVGVASAGAASLLAGVAVSWSLGSLPASSGGLETARTHSLVLRKVIETLRVIRDGDGDGYAEALCDRDCDCNDHDAGINPGAVEIPDDGIDQNCSGEDLVRPAQLADAQEAELEMAARSVALAEVSPPYPILLITIDTLRADHVSSYGYQRPTTPVLDALAETAVRFEQARAQGPATRYSIPAMLTGRFFSTLPRELHGKWCRLLPQNHTFAEYLGEAGYATRAVMTYMRFSPQSGFGQGFDAWDTSIYELRSTSKNASGHQVTELGLQHLDALLEQGRPWLLWLHYFDPHSRYVEHPEGDFSFGEELVDLYDGEIAFTDAQIGKLFEGLRERGLWDQVAIIVASDHGEGFGGPDDHTVVYHGHSLYDVEVRVPLLVRVPGMPARVVETPVGLIDVAPTILELAGLAVPDSMHGHSLLPWLRGGRGRKAPVFVERPGDIQPNLADPFACHEGACGPLMGLVQWPHKLSWDVRHNRFELYDLQADPKERNDLAAAEPERAAELARTLEVMRYDMGQIDAQLPRTPE